MRRGTVCALLLAEILGTVEPDLPLSAINHNARVDEAIFQVIDFQEPQQTFRDEFVYALVSIKLDPVVPSSL